MGVSEVLLAVPISLFEYRPKMVRLEKLNSTLLLHDNDDDDDAAI